MPWPLSPWTTSSPRTDLESKSSFPNVDDAIDKALAQGFERGFEPGKRAARVRRGQRRGACGRCLSARCAGRGVSVRLGPVRSRINVMSYRFVRT